MTVPLDLVADHRELVDAIKEQIGDIKPAAVALDTLNRSLVGSESSDEDMAAYVMAADAIKLAFDCAVLVVHHCGHAGERPRGHSSLTAAADVQIKVSRDSADNVIAEVEVAKDGPAGKIITSRLEVVEVGIDDEGDPIKSCVIVPAEGGERAHGKPKSRAIPKAAQTALRALQIAISDDGKPGPGTNHVPTTVITVTVETWRRYAYKAGISTSPEERARQQAFKRASEYLIGSGTVGIWDQLVWVA